MYEYRVIDLHSMALDRAGVDRRATPLSRPEMEELLNEAAREGYRFVTVLADPPGARRTGLGSVILLEREVADG